ncbi:MAG: hypothetical protein P8Y13_10765 [Deinococcales bacterium]
MRRSISVWVAPGLMFGAAAGTSDAVSMPVGMGAGVALGALVRAWNGRTRHHDEEDVA